MNTDFVELIKDNVSAIVLKGETDHLFEKDQALSNFYPVFLSMLRTRPEWIETLNSQLNPKISEFFQGDQALKQQFLSQFVGSAPPEEIEHTLNQAISPTLGFLQTEAGSSDPEAIIHLIENNEASIRNALPNWALPILASLGVTQIPRSSAPPQPEQAFSPAEHPVDEERKKTSWLPFIIFLILATIALFLYKACSDRKHLDEASTTGQVAAQQPALLQLATGESGDIASCQIHLNNPSYMDILQGEIKRIFNHTIGCGAMTDASYHTSFVDQDTIPSILNLIKGKPNMSLNWSGHDILLQGQNAQDVQAVASEIRALAKNMTVNTASAMSSSEAIASTPMNIDDTVNMANSDAEKALASIKADNVTALDVATALNLQIINFETGSDDIPDVNKTILDQAAALLKRAPHVSLKVVGHTDATGDAAKNKELSHERAESVVDYLIDQGADPAQLQAIGMGQEQPRADNATEEGKFKNRRIEFEVLNTETGKVRAVDAEGVKVQ